LTVKFRPLISAPLSDFTVTIPACPPAFSFGNSRFLVIFTIPVHDHYLKFTHRSQA